MNQKYPWLLPILLSPLGLIIPIAPRSGPIWVLLIGIAGIVHYIRHRPSLDWLKSPPIYALCAFLAYLFLTGFWSINPERSFEQAFRLTMLAFFGLAGYSLVRSLEEYQKRRVVQCLLPALFVGIVTGCVHGLLQYTGSYIRILTDFLGLSRELSSFSNENRLHVAKTMLLANLGFFAVLPWILKKNKYLAMASFLMFSAACFHCDSQSAAFVCLVAGIVMGMLQISKKLAPKLIIVSIVGSFIFAIPIATSTLPEKLDEALAGATIKLETASEERITIYSLFADLTLDSPLIGHGLISGVKYDGPTQNPNFHRITARSRTPHNLHLQIFFDLGATGAILFLLSFVWPIARWQSSGNQTMANIALLVVCITIAATSFNFVIWRAWIAGASILTFYFLFLDCSKNDFQTLDKH